MDSLVAYPENQEQLTALKAVMEAMKIAFEQKSEEYPQHVIEGVKESLRQAKNGEVAPYTGLRNMLKKA
ncbi:MAG: DUF2683 family protein [Mucilaginibacter sp.]